MKLSSLNKGLVGHWTMSQDSLKGSLLGDKTPYENDGTIYGATFTTDRKGKANGAMSFDGVTDYIDCGDLSTRIGKNNITYSLWVKPNTSGHNTTAVYDFDTFMGKADTLYSGDLSVGYRSDNKVRVYYENLSTGSYIDSINPIVINEWTHVTVTTNSSSVSLYIDGLLNATGSIATNFVINKMGIGSAVADTWCTYFNGSIDDVRIYNRALSQAEITLLYNSYNPKIVMKTSLPKIKLYGGDKEIKKNGFIRVDKNINNSIYFDNPESNLYGKTYFYVMQYQARNNGGVPQSTGDGLPWTSISQLDAIQKSKDAGYHLITNWEWMAIARDIEQVADNWTGGAVGSGMIKRGNVGITDDGSYDGANPETGILNDKAKLKLSNGEEIYHFSGNVWEWVDAQIPTQADMKPTGKYWPGEIKDVTDWGNGLAYSEIGPKDNTFTRSNGVGGIYYDTNCTSNRAFVRGGRWDSGATAGVFALGFGESPTGTYMYVGFRCARYGNE